MMLAHVTYLRYIVAAAADRFFGQMICVVASTKYKMLPFFFSSFSFRKLRNIQFLQISTSYNSNTARASFFFRLEEALFLNSAVYHLNQDPVCPSGSSIFLKISKYYHETWSKVFFRIHNTFLKKKTTTAVLPWRLRWPGSEVPHGKL